MEVLAKLWQLTAQLRTGSLIGNAVDGFVKIAYTDSIV